MSKIVIIGCGVVGAILAYELSLIPNLEITVIDKNMPATGATSAALGVLMGIISHKKKGRAWRLRENSIRRYQTLIPELSAKTGLEIAVNKYGIFKLLFEGDDLEKWQKLAEFRHAQGWNLKIGDRSYVRQHCPQIDHENLIGAVYSPQDGQIHPVQLTQAAIAAAQANGVEFRFQTRIEEFKIDVTQALSTCQQLITNHDTIPVDYLIITAGLGATPLTQTLQQTIPIRPVVGQAMEFGLERPLGNPDFQPAITGNDIHIVPLGNNKYWLGATVEFPDVTGASIAEPKLLEQIIQDAIAFCPQLQEAQILRTWSGKRPRPEGIPAPIIEELTGYNNIVMATAHYRNGVLLAPATALEVIKLLKLEQ